MRNRSIESTRISDHDTETNRETWVSLWVPTRRDARERQANQPDPLPIDQWHLMEQITEQNDWEQEKRQRREARKYA